MQICNTQKKLLSKMYFFLSGSGEFGSLCMDTMDNLEAFFDVDDEDAAADVDEDETDTEETEGGLLIHFILD